MDSKQPQVTSDEPAVNISGKLSSSTSIYTLYYLYIYIIFIYIYLLMPQPTQRAHCRVKVLFPREQAGPIIRGMVRRSFTGAARICCLPFWSSWQFALSHEAVTLRTRYKKVLATRLDTRAVGFFFFSFSLFQQAERASWANAHSTHTPNADQTSSTAAVVRPIRLPRASTTPNQAPPPGNAFPCGAKTTHREKERQQRKEKSRSSL